MDKNWAVKFAKRHTLKCFASQSLASVKCNPHEQISEDLLASSVPVLPAFEAASIKQIEQGGPKMTAILTHHGNLLLSTSEDTSLILNYKGEPSEQITHVAEDAVSVACTY